VRSIRRRAITTLGIAAVALTGCGLRPDAAPREVPDAQRADRVVVAVGGAASGASRIYLVGPGEDRLLRSVPREPEEGEHPISVLLRGPNETEVGFGSAIPATLEIRDIRQQGSRLLLDVTPELLGLSGSGLIQALAQIVYTANEIDGVLSVAIQVEGEPKAWPTADLTTTTGDLRVYDYPGLVRSAQPAYPSLPSGD
jgi:hypothetical protein